MTTGILHVYHPDRNLNLFEYLPSFQSKNNPAPKHVLLFIGGLYDTFNQPRYVNDIAALFPLHDQQTWRVMHVQLSSNGRSWGVMDIDRDVEEIGVCIQYIRDTLLKDNSTDIVLMGHSTGCQDIMRYLTGPNPLNEKGESRPKVQGAILQAPVSDRDAVLHVITEAPEIKRAFENAMKISESTPAETRKDIILPLSSTEPIFGSTPISVARWLSLVSPDSPDQPSIEDFFSNDLHDTTLVKTFGSIGKKGLLHRSTGETQQQQQLQSLLVLMSESDEYAGPKGSQTRLLQRWKEIMHEGTGASIHDESAAIANALHDVGGDDQPSKEARLVVLRRKLLHYLNHVVGDIGKQALQIWQRDADEIASMKTTSSA